MLVVAALACVGGYGLWLIASAVWPAPRRLISALAHLQSGRRLWLPTRSPSSGEPTMPLTIGRWLLKRVRTTALADAQTVSDLQLLARPLEVYAGTVALATIGGAFAGPVVWALASVGGFSLPTIASLWVLVVGAVVGWFLPRLLLRGEAARARTDFRHALGAYLDVMVLLLAAQEGPESSMDLAAQAGRGPAFSELRQAVWQARLSGDPVWETLDDLGERLRITELREIAAAGSLAGESGAAVRQSLTAKARALRQASLAEAETAARQRSQALFAPLVMMGLGFVLFIVYPLVTGLDFAGG